MDRNGDGQIADGTELFGSGTRLESGVRAGNGYAALAEQDSNGDGRITSGDASFDQLQVWVDANQNAIADAGELRGLADMGISELSLNATVGTEVDNGNRIGLVSTYRTQDGAEHEMADVWVARTQAPEASAQEMPELSDLAVAPPSDVLGAGESAAGTQAAQQSSATSSEPVSVERISTDDELQHSPLI
jgi:hypothetical protein